MTDDDLTPADVGDSLERIADDLDAVGTEGSFTFANRVRAMAAALQAERAAIEPYLLPLVASAEAGITAPHALASDHESIYDSVHRDVGPPPTIEVPEPVEETAEPATTAEDDE
jgi:hypothetical protein